jgi:hypothetical protein
MDESIQGDVARKWCTRREGPPSSKRSFILPYPGIYSYRYSDDNDNAYDDIDRYLSIDHGRENENPATYCHETSILILILMQDLSRP